MGNGGGRGGGRVIGNRTAAAFNRQRNRAGGLTERIARARRTLRRRPRARAR